MEGKIIRLLAGLAVLTLIASLLTPVWSAELSSDMLGYKEEIDYTPFWMKETRDSVGGAESSTTYLTDLGSDYQGSLVWLILMTAITMLLSAVAIFNDFKRRSARLRRTALAGAAVMALATPLVFMVNWTSALETSSYEGYELGFSGRQGGFGFDLEYGPGIGWYLYFLAFGILTVALIMSMAIMDREKA